MKDPNALLKFLVDISPNGIDGFEGLVAELLTAATGRRFFIAKSGSQGGRDLSTAGFHGVGIRVECKRYTPPKHPSEVELLGKLSQARQAGGVFDSWVLVTTTMLPDQTATALKREADDHHLDLSLMQATQLEALCADHPNVVIGWSKAEHRHEILSRLEALQTNASYQTELSALLAPFESPGLACLTERCIGWLREGLSNQAASRSRFFQHLNPLEKGFHHIQRTSVSEELTNWLQGSACAQPVLVLGDEGVGKSWAVAHWSLSAAEKANTPVLFISSQDVVPSDDADNILRKAMGRIFGTENQALTVARLIRRVKAKPPGRPTALIVLDGLNENPEINWPHLLARFQDDCSGFNVVATCRAAYWRQHSESFPTVQVGDYSETEFLRALDLRGYKPDEIPHRLRDFARRPRWTDLICRLAAKFESWDDVTLSRLIYEDWQDRFQKKLSLRGPDFRSDTFHDFLQKLAGQAQHPVREELLFEAIPSQARNRRLLEEFKSSGLFVQEGSRFRIKPELLPLGLALTLVDELAQKTEDCRVEFLESELERLCEADISSEILEQAILLSGERPDAGLCVLFLKKWFEARNRTVSFSAHAPANFARSAPEAYALATEQLWDGRLASNLERMLMNGLVSALDFKDSRPAIWRAIQRWMGLIDPLDRSQKALRENAHFMRPVVEKLFGCKPGKVHKFGLEFQILENVDHRKLRLTRLALRLISGRPDDDFADAFAAWAISRAAMDDYGDEQDLVDWLLRLRLRRKSGIVTWANQLKNSFLAASIRLITWKSPTFPPYVPGLLEPEDLSAEDRANLERSADGFDVTQWCSEMYTSGADLEWDKLEPLLCRFDRQRLQQLVRKRLGSLKDSSQSMPSRASGLASEYLLLLSETELQAIRRAHERIVEGPSPGSAYSEAEYFRILMAHSSEAQLPLLIDRPPTYAGEFPEQRAIYREPNADEMEDFFSYLAGDVPQSHRCRVLDFLGHFAACARDIPISLLRDLFGSSDSQTRTLTLRLAWLGQRKELADQLWSEDWRAGGGMGEGEEFYGSLLIGTAISPPVPFAELIPRVALRALPTIVRERGGVASELALLADVVDRMFGAIVGKASTGDEFFPDAELHLDANSYHGGGSLLAVQQAQVIEVGLGNRRWGGHDEPDLKDVVADILKPGFHPDPESEVLRGVIRREQDSGNPWFYTNLDYDALGSIIATNPELAGKWMAELPEQAERLIPRMRPFWDSLCMACLKFNYSVGLSLLKWLAQVKGGARLLETSTQQPLIFHGAFIFGQTHEQIEAFDFLLEQCRSDADLLNLTAVVLNEGQMQVVEAALAKAGQSNDLFERARATMLAGLVGLPDNRWPALDPENWWLVEVVRHSSRLRDSLGVSRRWWDEFVSVDEELAAQCSFRLMLKHVDLRLSGPVTKALAELGGLKAKFLALNYRDFLKTAAKNSKNLNKVFLGYPVLNDQVWPWV